MKKVLKIILGAVCLILAGIGIYAFFQFRDRHPNHQTDIKLYAPPGTLEAGFAKVDITPTDFETWEDVNGNAKYDPDSGDRYIDKNGNGKFDAIWLAGFHNARPAQGVQDKLWARSMVLKSGDITLALCVIDMIGFGNDEVIATRKMISEALPDIDYVIVASTHVHSSPDVMGIWGAIRICKRHQQSICHASSDRDQRRGSSGVCDEEKSTRKICRRTPQTEGSGG